MTDSERLKAANRYLNLIRNKPKRDYGFAYLSWMGNGSVGESPDRGRLSYMAAQGVRMQLSSILGDDPYREVAPHLQPRVSRRFSRT